MRSKKIVPLTDRALHVLELSEVIAREWHHRSIDSEHVLVALVQEGNGVAAHVLKYFGADLERIKTTALDLFGAEEDAPADDPALSDAIYQLQKWAYEEAVLLRHYYVGTEHLLLAITRVTEGRCLELIKALSLAPDEIRSEVWSVLGHFE